MKTRVLGNSERSVSEIGLGCWQLGADWGTVSDKDALEILESAIDCGIRFLDTADVYGAGRSERMIGQFIRRRSEELFIATKVGRQNYPGPYTAPLIRQHICESIDRLGVESLDLLQLHCIPTEVMSNGEIFDWLRNFKREGLIKNFGASVESMEAALLVLKQADVTSLQIIFNLFRQKPIHTLFEKASAQGVGIIVRLPLASGVLSGKFTIDTQFAADDHRNYNRDGDAFNVGETFAGLPFELAVELATQIKPMVPLGLTMAQFAQRWILDHDAVTTMITGASRPSQVKSNAVVSDLPKLSSQIHQQMASFYNEKVHEHIRGVY
ncbi:General stress protein 69 [Planctomycetes bacterium CA13]|uniref:General stress protein 69 n=1 Tax=Novipirellula herctigrandis TaxID=2527986 RepID=A0A5C5ZDG2_9BACT|nr:General stress protein 69 [Planctomycetes bacterium CA13]